MEKHEITQWFSNEGTRNEVRMRVIEALADEEPGESRFEPSRYIYYVETLNSGNRVYLQRPARYYYGFDFLVCVENANYALPGERRRNFPSHKDFVQDLREKRRENPAMYIKLYKLLRKVYKCRDVSNGEVEGIEFSCGLPVDHILKVFKWLFIEQDIRFWNGAGRKMTWGVVPEP